jgi:murein DD-endopeptidase MepM/ murein hydrolase activator NlpD
VSNSTPRARQIRARALTSAAGLLVAAPVAGWLLIGSGGQADSANSQAPADLERQLPAGDLLQARATADPELEAQARNRLQRTSVTVSPGDTLIQLLQQTGLSAREAFLAVKELQTVYSPRKLRPGQDIQIALLHDDTTADADPRLKRLKLRADAETDVAVARTAEGGFEAEKQARNLSRQVTGVATEIDSSLFAAGERAGVPAQIMLQLIHQYSYAVDFQRDLRAGDQVEIVYERFLEADGGIAKTGPLLYAALQVQGERLEMYRYTPKDGKTAYFAPNGESVRRLLMRTPIDGARLSSGYGMRRHPIKGYTRMHEGTDFAAPPGTPIYASGNGTIERIGYNGGYGNYVQIDHGHGFETAYGHMRGFKQGLDRGDRVSQGEVIGYVGNTGQSTGPHLHYEILKRGEPVNPRGLDLPTGRTLTGAELDRFKQAMADIDRLRQRMPDTGTKVAKIDCPEGDSCR